MPRGLFKKFYDQDRPSGSSNNIRKVSFMNGGGGRVKKNRRPEPLFKQYVDDNDVEMGGGGERKNWKRNNKFRKNFKGRPGSPGVRQQQQQPPLRINDWYQVRILYGSKYEKNQLLQLILNHISPNVFIPNSYSLAGNDVIFYIDDFEIAKLLRNASRKILLNDGHMMHIKVREGVPPSVPVTDELKDKLKLVMAKRYIDDKKALDLSKFSSDPGFLGDIYCPLSRPAIMKVIWQIINENISDIVAVNLSNNKISVIEDSTALEIKKLKNLKIIHLGENNIKSLHVLNCFRDLDLTELVLKKNPLIKMYKDNAHYVRYGLGVT